MLKTEEGDRILDTEKLLFESYNRAMKKVMIDFLTILNLKKF